MLPSPDVTRGVLWFATGALVLYDVYALHRGGLESTISRVVLEHSKLNPILPFLAGLLCGHLFARQ